MILQDVGCADKNRCFVLISDFIRHASLNVKPLFRKPTPERDTMIKTLAQLGKLGSNVNQIARAINRQMALGNPIDVSAEHINAVLRDISALSTYLINALAHGH